MVMVCLDQDTRMTWPEKGYGLGSNKSLVQFKETLWFGLKQILPLVSRLRLVNSNYHC